VTHERDLLYVGFPREPYIHRAPFEIQSGLFVVAALSSQYDCRSVAQCVEVWRSVL